MQITPGMHGSATTYRYGCRCTDCRIAHSEECATRKFERRFGNGAPMGPQIRAQVLASLRITRSVIATARALEVTHQAIYGACRAIPEFGDQVDESTRAKGD